MNNKTITISELFTLFFKDKYIFIFFIISCLFLGNIYIKKQESRVYAEINLRTVDEVFMKHPNLSKPFDMFSKELFLYSNFQKWFDQFAKKNTDSALFNEAEKKNFFEVLEIEQKIDRSSSMKLSIKVFSKDLEKINAYYDYLKYIKNITTSKIKEQLSRDFRVYNEFNLEQIKLRNSISNTVNSDPENNSHFLCDELLNQQFVIYRMIKEFDKRGGYRLEKPGNTSHDFSAQPIVYLVSILFSIFLSVSISLMKYSLRKG